MREGERTNTMLKRFTPLLILVLVVSGGLVLACSPQLRVGWIGSAQGDQMQYRYNTFSGTERAVVQMEAGQQLVVTYDITVDKGALALRILGPQDNVLWEERYQENGEGEISIAPTENGRHEIIVEGQIAGGSFTVSWQVEGS